MKFLSFLIFLTSILVFAQEKDASDFFKSHSVYRKVNNVLKFIDSSPTILLNDYNKSTTYTLITPIQENSFVISVHNEFPVKYKDQYKCFKLSENRYVVLLDRTDSNFFETKSYKDNFEINMEELISCDELFNKLKKNKLPKIPVNVFAYSIFDKSLIYLEDLASFDALLYLEIEYDLNKK